MYTMDRDEPLSGKKAPSPRGLSPQATGGVYTSKKRLPLVIGEGALLIADYFELG